VKIERYSFIILVLISVICSSAAVGYGIHQDANSEHKWCQIINTITAIPVDKPANPKENPSRERSWEFYQEFITLKRSLGC
jgi:hypothetical protein